MNNAKKILMVGDGNHYFNRKLVEKLKIKNQKLIIDFFSLKKRDENLLFPYDQFINGAVSRKDVPLLFKIPGLFGMYVEYVLGEKLKLLLKNTHYDVIHLQGCNHWVSRIMTSGVLEPIKIVMTIWGSDFYRATKRRKTQLKRISQKADLISVATEKISADFDREFHTKEKHRIVKFGLQIFENIDKYRNLVTREDNKILVTLGYNRHPAQQHFYVLKELENLSKDEKRKIKLILPLTYGPAKKGYVHRLQKKLETLNIEYEFLLEFMDENEVAIQSLKSDLMIQVQRTDAFSGTMQEYMYADNIIITGAWLPYNELVEKGVNFYQVNDIESIPGVLSGIIENLEKNKEECSNNRKILKAISSWEKNIPKWESLYYSVEKE